ncbi:MAG: Mur ligase family protein [Erysipelotrichaceae bacterium]|nr:Mur ligase family protein [Erysipelotrichaceae bacterium]
MKFLLLGKGKSIESIKKYLKSKKCQYIQAVFDFEYKKKYSLIDEELLNLKDIDFAIKSPGIKETNKLYLKLALNFTFISELDLLNIFNEKVKCIVITGSNGKTTFVSMLTYLLKKSKIKAICCGNSFLPITHYYKKFDKLDYLIVEQSSFQLHDLKMFKPYISLILNLQNNHLDSSYSLKSYFENKKNIYKYQNKECYFIYDSNMNLSIDTNATIIDLLTYPNIDKINDNLKKYHCNFNYIYTIVKLLNINENNILYLNNFKPLKYREQLIYNNKNIKIINDSKSTSVDATLFALSHIDNLKNTILIIGGKDKNLSLARLNEIKIKYIICYGKLNDRACKEIKNVLLANNLKEAFLIAYNITLANKTILFSPATSSFDQYKSFEQRGQHFNKLVKKYVKENNK